ncbi:hypothetical protein TNCV_2245251 [Trichonephila clavipes]|nr:hypothetical protein TNCV_2245251 [Trichonephila clavipes]
MGRRLFLPRGTVAWEKSCEFPSSRQDFFPEGQGLMRSRWLVYWILVRRGRSCAFVCVDNQLTLRDMELTTLTGLTFMPSMFCQFE